MLPKLQRKSVTNELSRTGNEESKSQDYVFRLIPTCTPPLSLNESHSDLNETITDEISAVVDSITKLRYRLLPLTIIGQSNYTSK